MAAAAKLRGAEAPAAIAADRDADDVVALRIERLEDRARREQRDVVLARAAPGDERDAEATAHGGVVVVPVVGAPVESWPTVSVISVFFGACVPPAGVSLRTTPSEFGSDTGWYTTLSRKPEDLSVCSAVPRS